MLDINKILQQPVERKFRLWHVPISGLVVGLFAALVIGQIAPLFSMPAELGQMPLQPSPEYLSRYNAAHRQMFCGNYATYFAIVGGLIGLAAGIVGARRNWLVSLMATSLSGALAGMIGGYLLGMGVAVCIQGNISESMNFIGIPIEPIVQTTALQCFIWSMIGMATGSSLTVANSGLARIAKGIEGGLAGGLVAGTINSLVVATFYSLSNAFLVVPETLSQRIIWASIGGLCINFGLIRGLVKPKQVQ